MVKSSEIGMPEYFSIEDRSVSVSKLNDMHKSIKDLEAEVFRRKEKTVAKKSVDLYAKNSLGFDIPLYTMVHLAPNYSLENDFVDLNADCDYVISQYPTGITGILQTDAVSNSVAKVAIDGISICRVSYLKKFTENQCFVSLEEEYTSTEIYPLPTAYGNWKVLKDSYEDGRLYGFSIVSFSSSQLILIKNNSGMVVPAYSLLEIYDHDYADYYFKARRPSANNLLNVVVTEFEIPIDGFAYLDKTWPKRVKSDTISTNDRVGSVKDSFEVSRYSNGFIVAFRGQFDGTSFIRPSDGQIPLLCRATQDATSSTVRVRYSTYDGTLIGDEFTVRTLV